MPQSFLANSNLEVNRSAWAFWTEADAGIVCLESDWKGPTLPRLRWEHQDDCRVTLSRPPLYRYAEWSGYFVSEQWVTFMLKWDAVAVAAEDGEEVYLVGDFTGWKRSLGNPFWKLERARFDDQDFQVINVNMATVLAGTGTDFRFITGQGRWLPNPSPMRSMLDNNGRNRNLSLDFSRTGRHLFAFSSEEMIQFEEPRHLLMVAATGPRRIQVKPEPFLLRMECPEPMGVEIVGEVTRFRIFCPRAVSMRLRLCHAMNTDSVELHAMAKVGNGAWETTVPGDRSRWLYEFEVDMPEFVTSRSGTETVTVVDPYALATVGPAGPGLVLDRRRLSPCRSRFEPPEPQDLIVLECHLRDLLASVPATLSNRESMGFSGLTRWLEESDCYLRNLGVNAIELLPVMQFDTVPDEAYQWGYMPNQWFAPTSHYTTSPAQGTQLKEFRELVDTCHRFGLAVILDVVYNHLGLPNHLYNLDGHYYFHHNDAGELTNWSGCGNDFRTDTPMGKRLILESLEFLVAHYDVDGFRFDLAELLGIEILGEIERKLRRTKPSIILIAEPWSFKGHVGTSLKNTGYAYWNDHYREFVYQYILGCERAHDLPYFISGSIGHLCRRTDQSVNYVSSHDDHCWIDRITENPSCNGHSPTSTDRRRTHLMIGLLMVSLGIPMIAAGQDLLQSKQGASNTHLRGDLNALDYSRAQEFPATYQYFREWIRFRRSSRGLSLRPGPRIDEGYLRFFEEDSDRALGVLFNAHRKSNSPQLFFAINPLPNALNLRLPELDLRDWIQLSDHERFARDGLESARFSAREHFLSLPPLSCGLWIERLAR